jgi:hypothetical protein
VSEFPSIHDKLEPEALADADARNAPSELYQASIAVSLKRIADIAEAWAAGTFNYSPQEPRP